MLLSPFVLVVVNLGILKTLGKNILKKKLVRMQKDLFDYMGESKNRIIRDTSRDAYHDLVSHPYEINGRRLEVLKALNDIGTPSTDQEIKKHLQKSEPNYVRPRRFELVELGYIECFIKRDCKVTGKKVYTWKITPRGFEFLNNNGG